MAQKFGNGYPTWTINSLNQELCLPPIWFTNIWHTFFPTDKQAYASGRVAITAATSEPSRKSHEKLEANLLSRSAEGGVEVHELGFKIVAAVFLVGAGEN